MTVLPIMTCDHPRCIRQVKWAPRVVIHSTRPMEREHRPIRVMTALHYCELHYGEFEVERFVTPELKRRVEALARTARPTGFVPDFENAYGEQVLVTTPEYAAFTKRLFGAEHVVA